MTLVFFGVNQPFISGNSYKTLVDIAQLRSSDNVSLMFRFPALTGARESLETAPGSYKLILDNRKAWSGGCCLHVRMFWTIGIEGGLTPTAIPGDR